jgi:PAS domain S-box-containing protein
VICISIWKITKIGNSMSDQLTPGGDHTAALLDELDRYRFLARLDGAIRYLTDAADITNAATALVRDYFGVDRCTCVAAPDGGARPMAPSEEQRVDGMRWDDGIAGRYERGFFNAVLAQSCDLGEPCVVDDVETDPRLADVRSAWRRMGLGAVVIVPVVEAGRLVACMTLEQAARRHWQRPEVTLLAAVAGRCWEALARCQLALELRNAEARIRSSRDYLRLLIDSGEEGFYSVDRDGVTIMCNAAFLKMLGFAREEDAIGKKLHDVIHHSHPDGHQYAACDCPIYQAAQFGTPAHVEDEMFFRLDGTGFPVEYRARPVWQDGVLQGAVCTFVDVTERRRTEHALQQSEAHLKSLFAQTGAGISEGDLTGRLFRMNDRFCQIVGRSREELLSMRMQDFTHPDDLAVNVALFERAIATRMPFEVEKRYVRPDGSIVWVNNTVSPVRSTDDGPVDSMLAVSVDISERKLAEEALREADRRKDEFLAMLAHELRNPMAPIRAAADLMQVAHLDPERLRRTSRIIARQVRHMTGLVDDLLDVSRVTRGLAELEKTDLDVKLVIADALEQVRPLIEEKRHHLTVDLDPAPAHVTGDQKRLVQILTNLLNNAAKFTPEGGIIHLTMQASDDRVHLHVADNGVGIPLELQPQIFELFAQAERSPDRSQGGLGIGLALVKSLVELHGGSVHCRSEGAGKGSDFIVTLPRAVGPGQGSLAQHEDGARMGPVMRRRILIVDDNVDAAQMLAMYLEVAGHDVVVENHSARALERARQIKPAVCVLDIGLPDIDGNELAQLLRRQPETAQAVLIALTGYGQERDRQRSLEAGFDHFLVKPVDAATVLGLVQASTDVSQP